MRVALLPFFSQQDKRSGKFQLDSDSGVKLYAYIAKQLEDAVLFLPHPDRCNGTVDVPTHVLSYVPTDNLQRRLHWDTQLMLQLAQYDVVLTQHEFLCYPLRCLHPKLCTIMECGIRPDTAWSQTAELFPLAQRAANAVHCNSKLLGETVDARRVLYWPFAYDADNVIPSNPEKLLEVVFPARASATGYSNHELFVEAFRSTSLRVLMTDPTNYLRKTKGCPQQWLYAQPLLQHEYWSVLSRARVVVGLTANGYGGYAFQEAIVAGCYPVALRCPEYVELLGVDWPHFCSSDPANLRAVTFEAMRAPDLPRFRSLQRRLKQHSYQAAWERARVDLEEVYHDHRFGGA